MIDLETLRYGSGRLSLEGEYDTAGLFGSSGIPNAYWEDRPMRIAGDGWITVSGAGGGKMAGCLAYALALDTDTTTIFLDPRGEGSATFDFNLARTGTYGWNWNPFSILTGLIGGQSLNVLDILSIDSPTFHADAGFIGSAIIPLRENAGPNAYFGQKAQEWVIGIIKSLALRDGFPSFPSFYRTANMIVSDIEGWKQHLAFMLAAPFDDVRRVAGEMLTKQTSGGDEFGSVIGELFARIAVLDDPALLASLEPSDFSLKVVADKARKHRITLNVPASYIERLAAIIRVIFTVAMLYKERAPDAPRVNFICDEAGQMKYFPALERMFTYGRGCGIRPWALFQDLGQIARHYGREGIQTFLGSAQTRQFFCVRDYETANLISKMLGSATIEYDDEVRQGEARRQKWSAFTRMMDGDDPLEVGADYAQYEHASQNRIKQARPVLYPDEILALPDNRQLLFISGKNLRPGLVWKHHYWTRPEMAGRFLNNPYHDDPFGPITVTTRWGRRRVNTVVEDPPAQLQHLPQFRSMPLRYPQGYRPI